ncbi:hypothetical protein CN311_02990 [Mesorhizobium sanjuanii]|uniref:HTH araC/xylS-type domain-containing protein n=2 Tax=Mesorhizobium sanjuanii TaxID=2037900 RepID=A0A2A6FKX5_9HYPH|nr:hypothetical protein CN311_02990 [Mesorhizobium sanjuanii]
MQFYRSLRLEKADEILLQSNLPLVEVALATGFSNRSHFSRAFQACFGMGPATRRKQRRHGEGPGSSHRGEFSPASNISGATLLAVAGKKPENHMYY